MHAYIHNYFPSWTLDGPGAGPAPSGSLEPSRGLLPASAAQEEEQHAHQIPGSGGRESHKMSQECNRIL